MSEMLGLIFNKKNEVGAGGCFLLIESLRKN